MILSNAPYPPLNPRGGMKSIDRTMCSGYRSFLFPRGGTKSKDRNMRAGGRSFFSLRVGTESTDKDACLLLVLSPLLRLRGGEGAL